MDLLGWLARPRLLSRDVLLVLFYVLILASAPQSLFFCSGAPRPASSASSSMLVLSVLVRSLFPSFPPEPIPSLFRLSRSLHSMHTPIRTAYASSPLSPLLPLCINSVLFDPESSRWILAIDPTLVMPPIRCLMITGEFSTGK
ncbi:hypothetical protein B0H10DRAFT_2038212 [Mycena sp. CBHHK59/15]|nr:hypothetical protein B0H10DRAFT_2038212 [Mycena sp. CBHHK59/15]